MAQNQRGRVTQILVVGSICQDVFFLLRGLSAISGRDASCFPKTSSTLAGAIGKE